MDFVSENIGSDVSLELIALRDVNPPWNQLLDFGDYAGVVEQVHSPFRVEADKQIDVAVGALGAARS
ncbi:MAG: hypothetical protein WBE78_19980 [Candidatus Binataceae bacterium]